MYSTLLVLLHGLGSDGEDMRSVWQSVEAKEPDFWRQVLVLTPDAPFRQVHYAGGQRMRAWFDLYGIDEAAPEDWDGMMESREKIESIISDALSVHESIKHIIVGGFSQGGAMTYMLTLQTQRQNLLAGVVMSGWLPARGVDLYSHITDLGRKVPILACHGNVDHMALPPITFEQAYKKANINVEFKMYECGHTVIPSEIDDIAEFLENQLRGSETRCSM